MNNHFHLHMQLWFCDCGGLACHSVVIMSVVFSTIFILSIEVFWYLFFNHICHKGSETNSITNGTNILCRWKMNIYQYFRSPSNRYYNLYADCAVIKEVKQSHYNILIEVFKNTMERYKKWHWWSSESRENGHILPKCIKLTRQPTHNENQCLVQTFIFWCPARLALLFSFWWGCRTWGLGSLKMQKKWLVLLINYFY